MEKLRLRKILGILIKKKECSLKSGRFNECFAVVVNRKTSPQIKLLTITTRELLLISSGPFTISNSTNEIDKHEILVC